MTRTEPGTQALLVQLVAPQMTALELLHTQLTSLAIHGVQPEEDKAFKKVDLLTLTLNLARDFPHQQQQHRDKALNDH